MGYGIAVDGAGNAYVTGYADSFDFPTHNALYPNERGGDGFIAKIEDQNSTSIALTVTVTGSGTVTSTPAGIDCGPTCSASFSTATSVTLTATPAVGSTFAGWSPVECGGPLTLSADTTCTATFNLTNRPPIANAGPDQIVEGAGPNGTSVTLDGSASSDPDNDSLTFAWTGPFGTASGSKPTVTLPLGTHTITLAVSDGHGGTASDTVSVQVSDTTPPVLNLPADINVTATSSTGATVSYTASATDLVNGALTPTCAPASGSIFPIGTTTVTCAATDQAGNTTSGSFKVTVNNTIPPSEQVTAVTDYIQDSVAAGELTGVGSGNSANNKVEALINMIKAAGDLLEAGQTVQGCQQLADIYLKVDGVTPPPDFVTGPATAGLASAIQGLRAYYKCL